MVYAVSGLTLCGVIACILKNRQVGRTHKFSLYWVVALAGALLLLAVGPLSPGEVGAALTADRGLNPLKILLLFLSLSGLSVFLDEAGFFGWLSARAVRRSGGSQKKLFFGIYALVSVLTVFTSNDIIILTFTPFLCYFAARAEVDPRPYLFAEFAGANTFSMLLIFGNPTNVYIASAFSADFVHYFLVMALPTLCAGSAVTLVLYLLFRKELSRPISCADVGEVQMDRGLAAVGCAVLGACILLMALSSYIGLEMEWISLGGCLLVFAAALFRGKAGLDRIWGTLKRLPWALVPFLLGMFVVVTELDAVGLTAAVGSLLAGLPEVFGYGLASFFCCSLINNIPMSVLFTQILTAAGAGEGGMFAVVIGSNLGALFTPVGALAGIMWMRMASGTGVRIGFGKFTAVGALVSLPALLAALGALALVL